MLKQWTFLPSLSAGPVSRQTFIQRLLLTLSLLVSLPGFAQPGSDTHGLKAHFLPRDDGSRIEYYLIQAEPDAHPPAQAATLLLLLQGSDCESAAQRYSTYEKFHSVWPQADLLMVEKYGLTSELAYSGDAERPDCPQNYLSHDRPGQRRDDAIRVLEQLSTDYRQIIVMGGSEGAVIAALVSARYPVTATVMLNGGGRWFLEDILHNIRATADGPAEDDVRGFSGFATFIRTTEDSDIQVSNHGHAWWRESLNLDLQALLGKISNPLLLVQAEDDQQVDAAAASAMAEALKASSDTPVDFRLIPGLGHGFRDQTGSDQSGMVIQQVRLWLTSTLTD